MSEDRKSDNRRVVLYGPDGHPLPPTSGPSPTVTERLSEDALEQERKRLRRERTKRRRVIEEATKHRRLSRDFDSAAEPAAENSEDEDPCADLRQDDELDSQRPSESNGSRRPQVAPTPAPSPVEDLPTVRERLAYVASLIGTIVFLGIVVVLHPLPGAFYELVRIVVCLVSIWGVTMMYRLNRFGWVLFLSIVAVVFNPVLQFHLGREAWVVVDVVAMLGLLGAIPFAFLAKK